VKPLQDKHALVTGAGKRIGKAIAVALAGQGVHVTVHYHASGDAATETAEEIRRAGVSASLLEADLSDPAQAELLVERALEAVGQIDILVNSASVFSPSSLSNLAVDDLTWHVQINAMAPLQVARAFAGQGRPGDIINLLDTRILVYDATHVAYHLSKRMLHDLTRMMAVEFAPAIQVNAVAPGPVLPPEGKGERFLAERAKETLLERSGSVEAVVDACLFLLHSDYVTGQVLYVDGGHLMKGTMYG
jgi:NAD(P)-dependent dehydrogenase (short-subunit alcohol dehydrogenase family)